MRAMMLVAVMVVDFERRVMRKERRERKTFGQIRKYLFCTVGPTVSHVSITNGYLKSLLKRGLRKLVLKNFVWI